MIVVSIGGSETKERNPIAFFVDLEMMSVRRDKIPFYGFERSRGSDFKTKYVKIMNTMLFMLACG